MTSVTFSHVVLEKWLKVELGFSFRWGGPENGRQCVVSWVWSQPPEIPANHDFEFLECSPCSGGVVDAYWAALACWKGSEIQ